MSQYINQRDTLLSSLTEINSRLIGQCTDSNGDWPKLDFIIKPQTKADIQILSPHPGKRQGCGCPGNTNQPTGSLSFRRGIPVEIGLHFFGFLTQDRRKWPPFNSKGGNADCTEYRTTPSLENSNHDENSGHAFPFEFLGKYVFN